MGEGLEGESGGRQFLFNGNGVLVSPNEVLGPCT